MTVDNEQLPRKSRKEQAKTDLFSPMEEIVMGAIKKAEKYGDATFVEPLLLVYITNEDPEIKSRISEMMCALKISDAEVELVKALENPKFENHKSDILSFIWNSGFQPIEHVNLFAKISTSGSYLEALESLTIIEQMEPPMQEDSLIEAMIELRSYLADKPDPDKKDLLLAMHKVLTDLEKST